MPIHIENEICTNNGRKKHFKARINALTSSATPKGPKDHRRQLKVKQLHNIQSRTTK